MKHFSEFFMNTNHTNSAPVSCCSVFGTFQIHLSRPWRNIFNKLINIWLKPGSNIYSSVYYGFIVQLLGTIEQLSLQIQTIETQNKVIPNNAMADDDSLWTALLYLGIWGSVFLFPSIKMKHLQGILRLIYWTSKAATTLLNASWDDTSLMIFPLSLDVFFFLLIFANAKREVPRKFQNHQQLKVFS